MQDTTSPIQPQQAGHTCKKPSCWLYGFAAIGVVSVIFWILCAIALGYAWSKVQPFFSEDGSSSSTYSFQIDTDTPPIDADGNISLSEDQLRLLGLAGINPEAVQGQDPEVLRACAEAELGAERAAALESGAADPTLSDFLAIKRCLE
jgi:hypothetical protein